MLDSIEPLECACGATAVGPRQGRAMAALAIARATRSPSSHVRMLYVGRAHTAHTRPEFDGNLNSPKSAVLRLHHKIPSASTTACATTSGGSYPLRWARRGWASPTASWRRARAALPPTAPRPAPPRAGADLRRLRAAAGDGVLARRPHYNERSCAIRDVVAGDLPGASTETRGLFAHVLPQAVLDRPREGMVPDITAPTRAGQPAPAAGAPPPPDGPRRNVTMDAKRSRGQPGCIARGRTRGRTGAGRPWRSGRARKVHVDYAGRARALDHAHSRQEDGTPYPGVREQVQRHLVGPVLAALQAWDPVVGLVVGSYQGSRAAVRGYTPSRARWRRRARAPSGGRWARGASTRR